MLKSMLQYDTSDASSSNEAARTHEGGREELRLGRQAINLRLCEDEAHT